MPHLTNVTIGLREEIIFTPAAHVGSTVLESSVTVTPSSFHLLLRESRPLIEFIRRYKYGPLIDMHGPHSSVPGRTCLCFGIWLWDSIRWSYCHVRYNRTAYVRFFYWWWERSNPIIFPFGCFRWWVPICLFWKYIVITNSFTTCASILYNKI